jgi:predicted dehydrogenase
MHTIRAAIIGTGFMGSAHAEALRRLSNVDIVAVASDTEAHAHELSDRFDISRAVGDWQEIVDDPSVDVVHNCTPNNLHYEINKALVEAGKHVVAEKPLTITSDESRALVDLARERGVVNAVNFNYRSYPIIRHAHELVRSGDIGDVYLVHGHYVQDWLLYPADYNWRLESSVSGPSRAIADIGSHWLDLVQFITGLEIESVFADLFTVHSERRRPVEKAQTFKQGAGDTELVTVDTEDGGSILIRFRGGARGATTISQVSAGRKNHQWFEIDGGERALAWNQERPNELWMGRRNGPNENVMKDPALMHGSAAEYAHYPGGHPEGYPDGFKNMFRNVYRFIREGRTPGEGAEDFPTFEDGHRAVLLVEAVLESHRRQQWVDVGR